MSFALGNAYGRIDLDGGGAFNTINRVRGGLVGLGGSFLSGTAATVGFGAAIGAVALPVAAVGGAVGGLATAIGASTNAAADFESKMANVKALSFTNSDLDPAEIEAQFQALTNIAKEMGATTKYTSGEAADALAFLAMAGFAAQDSVAALPGVLAMASAGNLDLAQSADIASNILTAFQMDASRTGEVADILTATFTNSNVDLLMLGDSMKYVAPIAQQLGYSLEETAAAVGILGNAGIQGSMAGTTLRAALVKLSAPTDKATEMLAELGVSAEELADMSLPDMLTTLSGAMEGMSETQKTATIRTLVGREAMSGFMVLLDSAARGELPKFTEELGAAGGTAEQVAKTQLDNLRGKLTLLNSAFDGLKVKIGERFLPIFERGVEQLTSLLSENEESIVAFFDMIGDGIDRLVTNLGPLSEFIIPALGELGRIFLGLGNDMPGTTFNIQQFLDVLGLAPETVSFLAGALLGVQDFMAGVRTAVGNGAELAAAFWSWINGEGGVEATGPEMLSGIADLIIQLLTDQMPAIQEGMNKLGEVFWEWVDEAIPQAGEKMDTLLTTIQAWAASPEGQQRLQAIGAGIATYMLTGMGNALSDTTMIMGVLGKLASTLISLIPTAVEAYLTVGQGIAGGVFQGIYQTITGEEAPAQVTQLFSEMWGNVMQSLISTVVPVYGIALATEQFNSIRTKIAELDFLSIGTAIVEGIAQGISDGSSAIAEAATEAARQALDATKAWLGIHSPSDRAAEEVGQPIPEGAAVGVAAGASTFAKSLQDSLSLGTAPVGAAPAVGAAGLGNSISNAVGSITIIIQGAGSPGDVALAVRQELEKLFGLAQAGAAA